MDDIELRVLKSVFQNHKVALTFCNQYSEDIFLSSDGKIVAKAVVDYVKLYRSRPTVEVLVEKHSTNNDLLSSLLSLKDSLNEPYPDQNFAYDIEQLKYKFKKSKLELISHIKDFDAPELVSKNIQKLLNEVKSVDKQSSYAKATLKEQIPSFANNYQEKAKNPTLNRGILTGYSFIDYIKNGIVDNDLIIICGETGSGKSVWMNNMAIQMWKQQNSLDTEDFSKGHNVAYFSLEMSKEDCFQRSMARIASVSSYRLRDAKLMLEERKRVRSAVNFINKYPYQFDIIDVPRGFSCSQLEIILEDMSTSYVPEVIFIDYMNLMDDIDSDTDEDWLKLGELAGKLHEFTRVYKIPIITAVQLNRIDPGNSQKSSNKRVGLHRIGRSSLIAHHATLITQIETRPDEKDLPDFVYHILKNRHGESDKKHTILKDFSKCSITDKLFIPEEAVGYLENDDISEEVKFLD